MDNSIQMLLPQAEYAKILRPLLPVEAFAPDPRKLIILFTNLTILILGWAITTQMAVGMMTAWGV